MEEELEKYKKNIKKRISIMRRKIEISPALEIVILKEVEFAFGAGIKFILEDLQEEQKKFLQGFAYKGKN